MTTHSATMILDSIGVEAPRLPTLHLRYPRFIHAELMTHRVLSRNARSSRAVPIAKMIAEVENDPVIPLHWGAAQAGMQAYAECDVRVFVPDAAGRCFNLSREHAWLSARDEAVWHARAFMEAGYAKQLVNRLLEPFMHIDVLVTATEWDNFLALRDHPAAEPHIQMLARAVRDALAASTPKLLQPGEWHLPYITAEERNTFAVGKLRMVSARRCARISYKPFDGVQANVDDDFRKAEELASEAHWSPFEHQATPDEAIIQTALSDDVWAHPHEHGNLRGWRQHRKLFAGESGRAS